MKILYANVIEQHAEWGSEVGVNKGLQALGNSTHCIDYRKNRKRLHSIFNGYDWSDFDAFFLHRGDRFPIDIVQSIPIPKVFWASELLSRSWDQDHLLKGDFDYMWVHSLACKEKMLRENWAPEDKIGIMTGGFDPDLFRPMPDVEKEYDILFIGTMSERREAYVRALRESGYDVVVKKRIYGEEYVTEMNKAKVIVNAHMTENLDCETRLYEAMATGTPILTEPLSEEYKMFDINLKKGMVVFNSLEELKRHINNLLANDKLRAKIGRAGIGEANAKHTWGHRAAAVDTQLKRIIRKNKRKAARKAVRRN